MTSKKLYISDLDGTLLGPEAVLTDFTAENLNRMISAGLDFTVASARSLVSIQQIMRPVNLNLPVVEINGALISDIKTGRHHVINLIESSLAREIYQDIVLHNCRPFVLTHNGNEDRLYYEDAANPGMQAFLADHTEDHSKRALCKGPIEPAFDESIVCIIVIDSYEVMLKLTEMVREKFDSLLETHFFANPYLPQWQWLTIHDHKSRKDEAVRQLADDLGRKYDELVIFADGLNDLGLMEMGQLGATTIAPENALPEIKELAKHIIPSHASDSVVKYIMNDFNQI